MRVLLDTSCLVAAAVRQHEHHRATIEDLSRRRAAGHTFLDRNCGRTETIALTAAESWPVLRRHASRGVGGGRDYDGYIAECARKGKAGEILTGNVRHFEPIAGIRVVSP